MKDILRNKTFIIFLIIFFSLANSQFDEINLINGGFSKYFDNVSKVLQFKVPRINYNNSLKIKVEGDNYNNIISYYQDNKLENRIQLSQSLTNITVMWLTNQQILYESYLTVECIKNPCSLKIDINTIDIPELVVDQQPFTYYVTKENQKMIFKIINNSEYGELNENYILSIWAKGSKQINSTLEGVNVTRLSEKYNYYRFNFENLKQSEYKLFINGTVGDIINVGVLLFKIESDYSTINLYTYKKIDINGFEATNYIDKEVQNYKVDYMSDYINIYSLDYYKSFETTKKSVSSDPYFSIENINEPMFYSAHYLKSTKYDGEGNNKFSPQSLGNYYTYNIEPETSIGLIPMEPDKDFNFLTYEIFNKCGKISAYIYECENYPLCHLENIDKQNLTKIEGYNNYFYHSYKKEEWKNSISPISKKQNMLLIKCDKGGFKKSWDTCTFSVNMKTDKNTIIIRDFNKDSLPFIRFIRKDEENTYLFKSYKELIPIYLNIETYSGNINLNCSLNNTPSYEFRKIQLYKFNGKEDMILKIKGLEDSSFLMYDYYYQHYFRSFMRMGSNYLFSYEDLDNDQNKGSNVNNVDISIHFDLKDETNIYSLNNHLYYSFYPLNCKFNMSIYNKDLQWYGFYQDISNWEANFYQIKKPDKSPCIIYSSLYSEELKDGISLINSTPKLFLFNKDFNNIKFSYIHAQKNNDVNIGLNLVKKGRFLINIFLNDYNYKQDYIESNTTILLKSDVLVEKCNNFRFMCKIILIIKFENTSEVYREILEINISPNSGSSKTNKKLLIIILLIIIPLIILIIIAIGIVILKNRKNHKDLKEEVDKTSFIRPDNEPINTPEDTPGNISTNLLY